MINKIRETIEITIPKKFSEKQIGEFMTKFWNEYSKLTPKDKFYFDFTQTEWIANQNLLLLSGLIKYLYKLDIDFKIKLFPDDLNLTTPRQATQICQLWDIWKLYLIFDEEKHFDKYIIDFENSKIPYLYKTFGVKTNFNLFDRFSVIPFISLNYIENHSFENTNAQLKPVYTLNRVIHQELENCKCKHPFTKRTISAIITRELYDNFLDHFENSFFQSSQNWAFMSVSLKRNRKEDNQSLFRTNFEEEEIKEAKSFFYNSKNGKYNNDNLIQFSFIDFGSGIVRTLTDQYKKENNISETDLFTQIDDNKVLEYAFRHNTSKNPISKKWDKDQFITRGLFDLVSIVKRYNGLLIVRSNKGKILYNFSGTDKIRDAFSTFDKEKEEYFPGTYVSIYIPALRSEDFDESVIEIESDKTKKQYKKSKNINIFSEISELNTSKNYNQLFERLTKKLKSNEDDDCLTYISFWGIKDENIIRKIILFLAGNIEINQYNRIVIVYPPDKEIIQNINNEISTLNIRGEILDDFKIHPIPCIYYDIEKKDVFLEWIGITNESDKEKLNVLLYDEYSLAKSDLKEPYKAIGNTNIIDKYDNFSAKLPIAKTLLLYYEKYKSAIIQEAIEKFDCKKTAGLYLCNGNYYQEEFLQLTDILNDKGYRDAISLFLLEEIKLSHIDIQDFRKEIKFIAVTASSHKILDALIRQKDENEQTLIDKRNCIFLDSYLNFEDEIQNKLISGSKYVLICDALATGRLTKRLDDIIKKNQSELIAVAVIANTLDPNFEDYTYFENEFIKTNRFIALSQYPITKTQRNKLTDKQKSKPLIRINPYTNIPITFSDETTFKESILLSNEEFLECIDNEDIEIRFKLFNNLIHPYFLKTAQILQKEYEKIYNRQYEKSIVKKIVDKVKEKERNLAKYIFYPKNSDIKYLKLENLQVESSEIFGEGGFKYYELERYNPGNGWKFPHTTDFFKKEIDKDDLNKDVLILDDGSCSGDSLYQMINELSYYLPNKIIVISIIGRVEDHKREFFSKIKFIQAKDDREKSGIKDIEVKIYFGTHWHIPTFYQGENPYKEELQWLNTIIKIQNTPDRIRKFAKNIKNEIQPAEKGNDYKYFPKTQDETIETKKEILKIRNEIGKIVGFRFYKENFDWFNDFISKIENTDFTSKEINKGIEHFLMCLVYEPYLYKKIAQIIPEIRNLLERFIDAFIFKGLDISENLNYKWDKTDIVHLYFIAHTEERLAKNLTIENFVLLKDFVGYTKFDYILFKLLCYCPINNDKYTEVFTKIIRTINEFQQRNKTDSINKKINLFKHFVQSISSVETFNETINFLRDEYAKISSTAPEHKESVKAKLDSAATNLDTYIKNIDNTDTTISREIRNIPLEIKEDLSPALEIVGKILSLSKNYPAYFSKYITYFEQNDNSLRNRYDYLSDYIENIESLEKDDLEKMLKFIREIKDRFCTESSSSYSALAPYHIFSNPETFEFVKKISDYITDFKSNNSNYNIQLSDTENLYNITGIFPQYILETIVLSNLFNNLKEYADNTKPITIDVKKQDNSLTMEITNSIANTPTKKGSFLGTHLISNLNDCPNNIFKYENNDNVQDKQQFIQTLTFKIA